MKKKGLGKRLSGFDENKSRNKRLCQKIVSQYVNDIDQGHIVPMERCALLPPPLILPSCCKMASVKPPILISCAYSEISNKSSETLIDFS